MAWIRWRTALNGRRLAHLQWRDELGSVQSKSLRTDNEAVAKTYLRAFERSHGARSTAFDLTRHGSLRATPRRP